MAANRSSLNLAPFATLALLAGAALRLAAVPPPFADIGHYLWAQGGTRVLYKSNCSSPTAIGFCTSSAPFNPNAAIGAGTDIALDSARYGIHPFAGALSPSRGSLEGEQWPVGTTLNLVRALAAHPSNPLNLPAGYQPTAQDAYDLEYVTLDGQRPAVETLAALRARLGASTPPASGCPTCPACPPQAICPPIRPPLPVCLCSPAGQKFEPSIASSGRLTVVLMTANADGSCPPC